MDNMRFGSYEQNNPKEDVQKIKPKRNFVRKMMYGVIFLCVLVIISFLVFYIKTSNSSILNKINGNTSYSALFLSNGQVYFGKIVSKDSSEIIVKDVFYLQSNNNSGVGGFVLLKLSNELHGPEDSMFINKDHILFYENLREDSKVVESIKNFKN